MTCSTDTGVLGRSFTVKAVADEGWKGFFKQLQVSLGLRVDRDIWRFELR